MRELPSFNDFILESVDQSHQTIVKRIPIEFDIDWNTAIGKVKDEVYLSMSPDSSGVFTIGEDVEKYCGLKEEEILRDLKAGKETPDGAIIYGLCNTMNGGKDVYFWTNGKRLAGAAKNNGLWPAIMEQISHEAGVHLTRQILTRAIAKNQGADIEKGEWIKFDYGSGEYFWPSVGDNGDKKNPIVIIDEESFATAAGLIVQTVTEEFLKMASDYIPELKMIIKT
jgi:hypothetical protein